MYDEYNDDTLDGNSYAVEAEQTDVYADPEPVDEEPVATDSGTVEVTYVGSRPRYYDGETQQRFVRNEPTAVDAETAERLTEGRVFVYADR